MEDIIKELYEFINNRYLADKEILFKEVRKMDHELENTEYDSYFEYSKQYHRFIDLMDLMTAYSNFEDRLEKVKNNIEYDKNLDR